MTGWVYHYLFLDYWVPTWPNAGAIPLCVALGGIGSFIFRRPLARVLERARARFHGPLHAELAAIRETAERAHRIAADTYRDHCGLDHPDAPREDDP